VGEAFPPREMCVGPARLAVLAADCPEETFAVFDGEGEWTYAQFREKSLRVAAALHRLGVVRHDRVLVWLPNGQDCLRSWFGINALAAIYVPINTAYRGRLLQHVIDNAGAGVLIVHHRLLSRLDDVDTAGIQHVVVLGGPAPAGNRYESADIFDLPAAESDVPANDSQPWDPMCILYTSGTTGPSKGVLTPYAQIWATNVAFRDRFLPSDRFLVHLPLFHSGGISNTIAALEIGGSITVVEAFDRHSFWEMIERTQTTAAMLISAMVTLLLKVPERDTDTKNPFRVAFVAPFTDDAERLRKRFGLEVVYTQFNMTEVSVPLMSDPNPTVVGTCGRPRPGAQVRLVDEHDLEVAPGAVGEMVVRTDLPWTMNAGYWGDPDATAEAWRNGWFHTGDAFRVDEAGNYYFVDRMKDTIRRRGENISSFEVEAAILEHPAVREAAAVGVVSELAEEEVLAVVALAEGHGLDELAFCQFLAERLPHFMVPRYVRVVDELPKTPTGKIKKVELRSEGRAQAWDRESAGLVLRREHLQAGA
jgi:carnitine-CoA ligase